MVIKQSEVDEFVNDKPHLSHKLERLWIALEIVLGSTFTVHYDLHGRYKNLFYFNCFDMETRNIPTTPAIVVLSTVLAGAFGTPITQLDLFLPGHFCPLCIFGT